MEEDSDRDESSGMLLDKLTAEAPTHPDALVASTTNEPPTPTTKEVVDPPEQKATFKPLSLRRRRDEPATPPHAGVPNTVSPINPIKKAPKKTRVHPPASIPTPSSLPTTKKT
ncbi:hypothetical protein SAMD00019534_109990 [Acytostelium subglobosum LB1]|nr:hypothetical protein SAMD00019534_109990 [Acytostelium subglobosum LB1]GAM27823.1 hypothetical protein SAMD00019534_109990 [Acytostelium subglobosum LB1]|eukprot:XP_012749106.1 hypothetical protein SAMD00019534_109990 [Acytostelium subglobosum LB1]